MTKTIIEVTAAFFGSFGYALLFRMKKKYWIPASLGGMTAWIIYLIMMRFNSGIFLSTLAAAGFGAIYSEILARVLKTPVTLFVLPSMVPLIPGGSLYYMMSYFVQGNKLAAGVYGEMVLLYAVAIAGGISITCTLWTMIRQLFLRGKAR